MNAGIFLAKGKITWNQEFISSNGIIQVGFTKVKDIWRPFQEKILYAAEIGTETTNIGERKIEGIDGLLFAGLVAFLFVVISMRFVLRREKSDSHNFHHLLSMAIQTSQYMAENRA